MMKNKCRNTSGKNHNEKSLIQNNEMSYNILPEYCKKNILPLKKILKNKIFISDFENTEYKNNKKNNNINNSKKCKPLTTRIKLEMINEENRNKKFNTRNNISKSKTETINTPTNNNIFATSKKIYFDNKNKNALKDINFKTLPYKCLSPNFQNGKHLKEKSHPSKIKEINNKTNSSSKGRNSYSINLSSSMMENTNKHMGNNSLVFPSNNNNSNNIIFLKKIKKENLKNKNSNNISHTLNYNIENISNFSTQSKKIIVFNNVNNYNINNSDNTLGNFSNIKNEQSYQQCYQKPNEDLNNFSSVIGQNYYRNPKKIYINNASLSNKNKIFKRNIFINKRQNSEVEPNIFYVDNSNNNNIFLEIQKLNKYQYNQNMIYKLNKKNNNNLVNKIIYQQNANNCNNMINNKNIDYSNIHNKERNTVNNKSHAYFNIIKENKSFNKRIRKNNTIEIFEQGGNHTKKSISPIQGIKNNF